MVHTSTNITYYSISYNQMVHTSTAMLFVNLVR